MNQPVSLVLDNLVVKRGSFTLGPINATIKNEEMTTVILGPNGLGKSTFLKSIAGIVDLEEGSIFLHGEEISKLRPQKRRIGLASQEPYLFQNLNVEENIMYGCKDRSIAGEIIERLGLSPLLKRDPTTLSGGEHQKVSATRAFASDPRLLLMDEPFSHLDRNIQNEVRRMVRDVIRTKMILIYVTHSLEEAYSLGDVFLYMDKGRMVESISLSALNRASIPKSRSFALILGYENFITGNVVSSEEGLITMRMDRLNLQGLGTAKVGERATIAIRPEESRSRSSR